MRNKYGNKKVVIDNITFDSRAEARRYEELKLLEAAGEISHLEVHPQWELIPAFTTAKGEKIRATHYEADFMYFEMPHLGRPPVIEDVKGVQTEAFRIKRKLLLSKMPYIDFRIVKA